MPKWKERRAGEDLRVSKGRYASEINFGIREEFDDDNDDEEYDGIRERRDKPKVKAVDDTERCDDRKYDVILLEAFENANEKFSQIRLNALTTICNRLQLHYIPKFVNKHLPTLKNIIESVFERNIGIEMKWIGRLIALCYMQLPRENKFLDRFRPMVIDAFDDPKLTTVRGDLCNAFVALIYLNKKNSKLVFNAMAKFEDIISSSCYVNIYCYNGVAKKTVTDEDLDLLVTSLEAWTFLYTIVVGDSKPWEMRGDTFIQNLVSLLRCTFYNLRIAIAKAIAVIHASGETEEKYYVESNKLKIIADISMIHKNFVPHDDKIKSAVLYYLKMGTVPRREIRIGKNILQLNTWSYNIQYDMLCNVFGSANIPKLLLENKFLFDLFREFNTFTEISEISSASTNQATTSTASVASRSNEEQVETVTQTVGSLKID